ncbi:MAG: cytochrome c biogenesis protein CcsA [Flavobacteriales bacterium]|jgi:cytochrome c-type biogenesis protein CcmF|tara:strand:+ start:4802 stop:7204 length:2403 start_codon:yes stop_codon:yes gene_type:complete
MEFIGEHTLIGNLGQAFISIAFAAILLAAFSFYKSARNEQLKVIWLPVARAAFYTHGLAVIGIISCMFIMIYNHYFEYQYVWQHSSLELPTHYMISCFWEGQEGSFLLWTFWNIILGSILMKTCKTWEPTVLTIVSVIQVFLVSMILGIYVFGIKLGSSPFVLIRNLEENVGLPWTELVNYLQVVPQFLDGKGLNPLLQNYWMVIHPPILFLGFALTMIPFSFAISGLWKKQYSEWIEEALPWTYAGIMVLGTGILMGGAWAYEALSFGGFWAWDPVENSSLVPWIILIAAAHLMLIHRARKTALPTTIALTILAFILIIYSTYLTRSGILGDTSVHAFAGGLSSQLLVYLLTFTFASILLFFIRLRNIPTTKKDDNTSSREFWMFIASMVLFISAFQITWFTSLPVINKVFGTNMAPPLDAIALYNSWQTPLALLIVFLVGITQYLSYKKTDIKKLIKQIAFSLILAGVLALYIAYTVQMWHALYLSLLWATLFAAIANFEYWRKILKGSWNHSGASVAHIGFALVIMGALLSNANKRTISSNEGFIAKDFPSNENILLEKGDTTHMGNYHVLYKSDTLLGINKIYEVEYFNLLEDSSYAYQFTLHPFIQLNEIMGNVAEPATEHFALYDVYTHLTYADTDVHDTNNPYHHESLINIKQGDSVIYNQHFLYLDSLMVNANTNIDSPKALDVMLIAKLRMQNMQGEFSTTQSIYAVKNNMAQSFPGFMEDGDLKYKFLFDEVNPEAGSIQIKAYEHIDNEKPFIVMKAIIFPYINVLWIGMIMMALGTGIAMIQLFRNKK